MKRLLPLALGLITLAAFPATSLASSAKGTYLFTDTVHVRAYKMSMQASPAGANHSALLLIGFARGTKFDVQEHYYQFTKNVRVRITPSGGATIKADLGRFGKINMTFAPGGGPVTPGCPGSYTAQHAGTLSGTFHFVSHNAYFKTINESSFRAVTLVSKKAPSCKPPSREQVHGTTLDVDSFTLGTGVIDDFNIERDSKGHVIEQFLVLDSSMAKQGVLISHAIDVGNLPASAFTSAADLSSATARAISQFMSGSVGFASTVVTGDSAFGTASGGITAKFDGMAPITLPNATTISTLSSD